MKTQNIAILVSLAAATALLGGCAQSGKNGGDRAQAAQITEAPLSIEKEIIPNTDPMYVSGNGIRLLLPPLEKMPVTGTAVASMSKFDDTICKFLRSWQVPGCSIAIAQHGRLVFARGYGWADLSRKAPVKPDSLFRIASVSKAVTSVTTLKLCQEHKLSLATKAFPLLALNETGDNEHPLDMRLNDINVQELLQCSGGWNREISGDPSFSPVVKLAGDEYSPTLRADAESVVRFSMHKPLDFTPGTRFAYSNLGYSVLGQLISKVTGQPYEQYVREAILKPMGITGMRTGKTLVPAANEVTYYPYPGQEADHSLFPNYKRTVPLCYGSDFILEAIPAEAGWLASPPEMAKFACTVFGDRGKLAPLSKDSVATMIDRPHLPDWQETKEYFAMGWEVIPDKQPGKSIIMRQGSFAGSMAVVAHRADGTTIAFAVNSRPEETGRFQYSLTQLIWNAVDQELGKVEGDQFNQFE